MAGFDILNATVNAYKTSWHARSYLLRLAMVPLALKLLCFALARAYANSAGEGGDYLVFMLIMLPALLAEGWMLSHFTRFLMLGQTWPFRPTGNMPADMAMLSSRARGVLSGMIVYVLTNMVLGVLVALMQHFLLPYVEMEQGGQQPEIPAYVGLLSLLSLVFTFWGFRLLWLYIPFALNMDGRDYIRAVRGFGSSLPMIAVWLLCFIPFYVAIELFNGLFGDIFKQGFGAETGAFIDIVLKVIADTLKSVVAGAGIVFGLKEIFTKERMTAA